MPQVAVKLKEIAELVSGELAGDGETVITGFRTLSEAGPSDLSFLDNEKYIKQFETTKARATIVGRSVDPKGKTVVKVDKPYVAFAKVLQEFAPQAPCPFQEVSNQAFVSPSASLGKGVRIGPGVYIGPGASVGNNTEIWPGTSIGPNCTIGNDCKIYSNVTIYHGCTLNDRVTVHSGTVIGADGFGFAPSGEKYEKVPQIGSVVVQEDVEIGANVTIDRGALADTLIGRGTKIDNLVMVAHNCRIGENSILVAQVGISGSTVLGKHVVLAGQAGTVGHITIGDYARVGAKSGVHKNVSKNEDVFGAPALPASEYKRLFAHFKRLPEMRERIKKLEEKLSKIQEKAD